jgi:hypothetical protein
MNHQQKGNDAARQRKRQQDTLGPPEMQPRKKSHFHYEQRISGRMGLTHPYVVMPDGVGEIYVIERKELTGDPWQTRGENQ